MGRAWFRCPRKLRSRGSLVAGDRVVGSRHCEYHVSTHFATVSIQMLREPIQTSAAPQAIGTYSQAVRAGNTVYVSGQIGLVPATMQLAEGIDAQIDQIFRNLAAVAAAASSSLDDAVKITVFLVDMGNFGRVNEIMAGYFKQPYPARAAVGVASLPRGALVEIEAILVLAA